ncbi:Canalicular multispecific organic anion transporter 2 [Pleurostoma richardsiae]|uniref:Canalicular multispecific organic anion transporter 2 n=1 Tax=Pleurostoma richardsiae TaxID=41990 RepID=A0AA38RWE1_9PEZI|nr:Canalicular multispecific organic anion transporter 2 [Pleurostoma richardsiae]
MGLLLLGFECRDKRPILLDAYKRLPPEATTSLLGKVFFWWINPILVKGYTNTILGKELPVVDHGLSSETLRRNALQAWVQRVRPEEITTLPRVLFSCLKGAFLAAIAPRLSLVFFRFAQPVLISQTIQFITGAATDEADDLTGYRIVPAAVVIYVGLAISTSVYKHALNRLEVMIRGALVSLLHGSSLSSRDGESNEGKVITLISNDVTSMEKSAEMFHETWAQLLEVIVGITLLAREVGWLWPLPLLIIFFCAQVSRYVANNLKGRQGRWNTATQNRMSMTTSVISSIRDIKMLGIQQALENHIQELRHTEMDAARSVRWLMVGYNASANALGMFAPVLTIVLYAILASLAGSSLDTETAFTTVAILGLVTHPANMIMTIVPRAVVSFLSSSRIQNYLLEDGILDSRLEVSQHSNSSQSSSQARQDVSKTTPAVRLQNVTVKDPTCTRTILKDISLDIAQGSMTICSGPVGAGKTTLARALLGELTPSDGTVAVTSKRIGYCAQTTWLPNQSIKDIIYGPVAESNRDPLWYKQAIHSCCLDEDLDALPARDDTVVGSGGMNLSGGQRQRLALARMVYARCSIAVLDDSFSALDQKTRTKAIMGLLGPDGLLKVSGMTVFWITNDTSYFHLADQVAVLADSTIQEKGSWESLRPHLKEIDSIIHSNKDTLQGTPTQPKSMLDKLSGASTSSAASKDLQRRTGDSSLYGYYFKSAGVANIILMVACTVLYGFFITFPQYWLKWWTESRSANTIFFVTGYLVLLLLAWIITNGQMWSTVLRIAPQSGIVLHRRLLRAIMGAPLLYFSQTDTGSILNRFGQDIQLVDKKLAPALQTLSVQVFKLIMQAGLLFAVQHLLTLTLPFCAAVVYLVQKVYLRTSRQLRLLELESRSAVYSSFLETVKGIATIRAFGWQKQMAAENSRGLDESQKPFYLLFCLQRWLNVVLDLLVAAIAVGTITLAVVLRGSTTGGQIGVALNLILVVNTTLLRLVESWTNLEISLGAIARLKEVEEDTPREDQPGEDFAPPEDWPSAGEVELKGVTAAYNSSATALRDLNLRITPGQTVVVCGRTGSGKSSFLLALLRLLDVQSGRIMVDGLDISKISRSTIRQKAFITVSQNPLILPNITLRLNLDPDRIATEDCLLDALRKTGLFSHYFGEAADVSPVLDEPISSLPTLSVGQAQLLALSRALVQLGVRSGKPGSRATFSDSLTIKPIVLLDEVTSSLDPTTEGRIYDIVQESFIQTGHTVVMVTHKLGAFKGRMRPGLDKVVWMKDGRVDKID